MVRVSAHANRSATGPGGNLLSKMESNLGKNEFFIVYGSLINCIKLSIRLYLRINCSSKCQANDDIIF